MFSTPSIRRCMCGSFVLALTALGVAASTPAFAQGCPGSNYSGSYYPSPVDASSSDISATIPAPGTASQYQLEWDHAMGTVRALSGGAGCPGPGGSAVVRSMDEFVLVGPPAAAVSIGIRASAHVHLGTGVMEVHGPGGPEYVCVTGTRALLRLATDSDSAEVELTQSPCPGPTAEQVLSLARSVVPGVPFRVDLLALAFTGCAASAEASATLSFTDLPVGYSIQSCSGFAGGVSVPTRSSTWGRIKSHYR